MAITRHKTAGVYRRHRILNEDDIWQNTKQESARPGVASKLAQGEGFEPRRAWRDVGEVARLLDAAPTDDLAGSTPWHRHCVLSRVAPTTGG